MAEFLGYKGLPLVRSGNTLYYGKMTDPYVVMMQVLATRQQSGLNTASRVQLYLMKTDPALNPVERIVKKSEQDTLFKAIDMASVWLARELSK